MQSVRQPSFLAVTKTLGETGDGPRSAFFQFFVDSELVLSMPSPTLNQWVDSLYQELRRCASMNMQKERSGHSFQTTDLVHEVYLRLAQLNDINWEDQHHVLRAAVGVMRRVLIDRARYNLTEKRNKNRRVDAPDALMIAPQEQRQLDELLSLDDALERLAKLDPALAEVVELKVFGGQELQTIAENLEVSLSTIKRRWSLAKAWLFRELNA